MHKIIGTFWAHLDIWFCWLLSWNSVGTKHLSSAFLNNIKTVCLHVCLIVVLFLVRLVSVYLPACLFDCCCCCCCWWDWYQFICPPVCIPNSFLGQATLFDKSLGLLNATHFSDADRIMLLQLLHQQENGLSPYLHLHHQHQSLSEVEKPPNHIVSLASELNFNWAASAWASVSALTLFPLLQLRWHKEYFKIYIGYSHHPSIAWPSLLSFRCQLANFSAFFQWQKSRFWKLHFLAIKHSINGPDIPLL